MNTTDPFPRVPFPAGAVKADWQDGSSPNAFRYFEGSRWVVDRHEDLPVEVYIASIQELDGTVKREIVVHQLHADDPINGRAGAPARSRTHRGYRRDRAVVALIDAMCDELLDVVRHPAMARLNELMGRVRIADMTTQEVLALIAVVELVDQRVNARIAPVLQLVVAATDEIDGLAPK